MAGRLFIGNLSYDVTEAELHTHFAAIGPLASLSLATDRTTGKPRGFAFVEFREQADAEEAIRRLNTQLFKGRPLAVSEARARDAQAPSRAPRPAGPRSPAVADTPRARTGTSAPRRCRGGGGRPRSAPRIPNVAQNAPSISAPPARCASVPQTTTGMKTRSAGPTGRVAAQRLPSLIPA